jgi:hypothetical protein
MAEQLARRDATQPVKERSAGSTFRNPAGYSSTGRDDDSHELKAWAVIDAAGMRGARLGGAQMSKSIPTSCSTPALPPPPILRRWARRSEKGFSNTAKSG